MNKLFYKDLKLGILGGGQLGRMLLQAAVKFNLQTQVLDPNRDSPCRKLCNTFVKGDFRNYNTVFEFGMNVNVLTIEIEHVNVDALFALEKQGVQVYPQPEVLRIIQDKAVQKEFLVTHKIPTAHFICLEDVSSYSGKYPIIQKSRRGGYDGRGVRRLLGDFKSDEPLKGPCIIEDEIQIKKEISVIVACNPSGEIAIYPPVEMVFNSQKHVVEFLLAPARVSQAMLNNINKIALQVVSAFRAVGLMAIEMFISNEGEVLVNEIAPRTHNSGHHTIEANLTSQFEQHLRAILNLPLGSTRAKAIATMFNILGERGFSGPAIYRGVEKVLACKGASLHLYGKTNTEPYRKMGHVTLLMDNEKQVLKESRRIKKMIKVCAVS